MTVKNVILFHQVAANNYKLFKKGRIIAFETF